MKMTVKVKKQMQKNLTLTRFWLHHKKNVPNLLALKLAWDGVSPKFPYSSPKMHTMPYPHSPQSQ